MHRAVEDQRRERKRGNQGSASSSLNSGVGWAFLPVESRSDKNVQPTF